jgi:PAS domain S-box-containing protein
VKYNSNDGRINAAKIWTSDATGNRDYFNKTLLDYTGKSFNELKGRGWAKIVHPDDFNKIKDMGRMHQNR